MVLVFHLTLLVLFFSASLAVMFKQNNKLPAENTRAATNKQNFLEKTAIFLKEKSLYTHFTNSLKVFEEKPKKQTILGTFFICTFLMYITYFCTIYPNNFKNLEFNAQTVSARLFFTFYYMTIISGMLGIISDPRDSIAYIKKVFSYKGKSKRQITIQASSTVFYVSLLSNGILYILYEMTNA